MCSWSFRNPPTAPSLSPMNEPNKPTTTWSVLDRWFKTGKISDGRRNNRNYLFSIDKWWTPRHNTALHCTSSAQLNSTRWRNKKIIEESSDFVCQSQFLRNPMLLRPSRLCLPVQRTDDMMMVDGRVVWKVATAEDRYVVRETEVIKIVVQMSYNRNAMGYSNCSTVLSQEKVHM